MATSIDAPLVLELKPFAHFDAQTTFGVPRAPEIRRLAPFGVGHRRSTFAPSWPAADGDDDSSNPGSPNSKGPAAASSSGRRDMGDKKKFVKLEEEDLATDWYELLKLVNAEGSTDEQIRSAYRRRCLETHPDKQTDGSDLLFKRVQRAFEILGNPEARRSYDSSRPFDDSIPSADIPEADFYSTYGPVFERNKKWSAVPNPPSLGDDSTTLKQARLFYDFWLSFRTWRDFSNDVEIQEIQDDMFREEKRYYQRENQRLLDKATKDEMKRVRTLVDNAMKLDPRFRRQRDKEEAERQRLVAERQAARDAALEAERKAKDDAENAAKQKAEAERQAVVETKNKHKVLMKEVADFFIAHDLLDAVASNKLLANKARKPNIQWVAQNMTLEEAEKLNEALKKASTELKQAPPPAGTCDEPDASESKTCVPAVLLFNKALMAIERRVGRNRYGEAIKKEDPAAAAAAAAAAKAKEDKKIPAANWTEDDLQQLQKAVNKIPGGAVDRWQRIAELLHNRFSADQIIERVKILETSYRAGGKPGGAAAANAGGIPDAPVATTATVVDDWTPAQQRQLEQGLREMKDYKEKDKYNKVAAFVEGKTAKQCFDRFKFLCAMRKQ